jgi:hypothetical protein
MQLALPSDHIYIPGAQFDEMATFSGHYVPQLSQLVYRNNKGIRKPILNFKGFMVRISCAHISMALN